MSPVKLLMVLTENETLVGPRDLRGLVDMAVQAETAGIDGIMMSEHVVLGPDSGAAGEMTNPRDYAAPGNQDPAYAWPNSAISASAISVRIHPGQTTFARTPTPPKSRAMLCTSAMRPALLVE